MNKINKERLNNLALEHLKERYPTFPEKYIPIPKYSEKGANELTKCVVDFINYSGFQAERINTMGKRIDNSRIDVDVIGRARKVGSAQWIPGTGTKGSADISATICGRSVKIEIKYGKDRQSEHQKKYQADIEKAGGIYIIVRKFDEFVSWFDEFTSKFLL